MSESTRPVNPKQLYKLINFLRFLIIKHSILRGACVHAHARAQVPARIYSTVHALHINASLYMYVYFQV